MKPEELKFAHSHEWAHFADVDGKQVATIGISAHAVEALSDVVYMELPEVGAEVTAGASFGEVESVKATSDLFSPVTGKVIEVNAGLPDNLEVLGTDPYGEGWIIKVEAADGFSDDALLDFKAYEAICNE